jgi:hypothetical protein
VAELDRELKVGLEEVAVSVEDMRTKLSQDWCGSLLLVYS